MALALVSILASSVAVAAPGKGKSKRGKRAKKNVPVQTLDGNDPVNTEGSEDGRYAPKGVTGQLKAEEQARAAKARKPPKAYVPPPRDPFVLLGDVVVGLGRAPKPGPATDAKTTDATLVSVVVGADYDIFPRFTAGVRIPWSTASMELPSGLTSEQEMAFGSPLVFGEYRVSLSRVTTLPIVFGVGVPLAQGLADPNALDDVSRRQGTVNRLADAARGWKESELYGVERFPIVLGIGLRYRAPRFEFHAYDRLVAGMDTGTRLTPNASEQGLLVVKNASVRNVTLVGVTYDLIEDPQIWAGLDAWLAYTAAEPIEFESPATDPTRLQFVAEPRAGARFGPFQPSIGLIFPIGGRLAESGISGVRLHVDYAF
ncbi:MAG TPA: hypothetical protein VIM73_08350 [Polyangiaceae bacterium]